MRMYRYISDRAVLTIALVILLFFFIIGLTYCLNFSNIQRVKKTTKTTNSSIIATLNPSNIKKITVVRYGTDWHKDGPKIVGHIDVTDSKKEIFIALQQNNYYEGGSSCTDAGMIVFDMIDGQSINIAYSNHGFSFRKPSTSFNEFNNKTLSMFVCALDFNKNARVFDEKKLERLLLPFVEKGDFRALDLLGEFEISSAAIALPKAIKAAETSGQIYLPWGLKKLNNINDKTAIVSVAEFVSSDNRRTCWDAIDILVAWGHLDIVKEMAKDKILASANLVQWFAANRMIDDMVCAVKTIGVEQFNLDWYSGLSWNYESAQDPALSWKTLSAEDKRKVMQLIADSLEHQDQTTTVFWPEGIEYDCTKKCFVEMNQELHNIYGVNMQGPDAEGTEKIFISKNIDGLKAPAPEVAQALRAWINHE